MKNFENKIKKRETFDETTFPANFDIRFSLFLQSRPTNAAQLKRKRKKKKRERKDRWLEKEKE